MHRWWHTMLRLVRSTVLRTTWIVPRNIICVVFWLGVIIVFIGMILLVTSKHKGSVFLYGGVSLLVMGLCIILACFALCMHAYFVLATTVDQEDFKARCEFKKSLQTITINPNDVEMNQMNRRQKPTMMVMPPKFRQLLTQAPSEISEETCFMTIPNNIKRPPRLSSQGTIYENEVHLHSMPSESEESVGKIIEDLDKPSKRKNLGEIGIAIEPLHQLKDIVFKDNKKDDRGKSFNERVKPKSRRKLDDRANSFEDNDVVNANDDVIKIDEINNSKTTVYDNVYHL